MYVKGCVWHPLHTLYSTMFMLVWIHMVFLLHECVSIELQWVDQTPPCLKKDYFLLRPWICEPMSAWLKATAEWFSVRAAVQSQVTPRCWCFTLFDSHTHTHTHIEMWCERLYKARLPLFNPAWLYTPHFALRLVHLSCSRLTLYSSNEDAFVSQKSFKLSSL